MDRRIQRTKEAIFEAFVGLMSEKSFQQITINDIADRANVNRGTVYLHFTDKYDLMAQCIADRINQLFQSCAPADGSNRFTSKDSLLRTFNYLARDAFFYSTMLTSQGIPAFRHQLYSAALRNIEGELDRSGFSGIAKDVQAQFLASAIVGVLEWWMTHDRPYPPSDMVDQFLLLLDRMQIIRQK